MLVDATHAILTPRELDDLLEYSCSLPTGTTIGKRWKRDSNAYNHMRGLPPAPPHWHMGEYAQHVHYECNGKLDADGLCTYVDIIWREILIVANEAAA